MVNSLRKYLLWTMYALVLCVAFFVPSERAQALDIQNLDYQIADPSIGAVSAHDINFLSASSINNGDMLSLDLPSDFIFGSSIQQSDIDIIVNGVSLSPSQYSLTHTGSLITIVFQTSAVPGAAVHITLKYSAQIQNPTGQGNYPVDFLVNSIVSASSDLWIFPKDSIAIGATVLGDPVIIGGGSSSSGGNSGSMCRNCFFNETEPNFETQGIIVSFKGYSHPDGVVQIFIDDNFVGIARANSQGLFLSAVDNITSGIHDFEFRAFDKNFVPAKKKTLTLSVGDKGFVYANDIFLAPTLVVEPRGEDAIIAYGYTIPYGKIELSLDAKNPETVIADATGLYFVQRPLSFFTIGDHHFQSSLKGEGPDLNSRKELLSITKMTGTNRKRLVYSKEPLFDAIIELPQKAATKNTSPLVYILSFIAGGCLIWIILWYRKRPLS